MSRAVNGRETLLSIDPALAVSPSLHGSGVRMGAKSSRSWIRWLSAGVALCVMTQAGAAGAPPRWVDGWYAAPVAPMPSWCCDEVRTFKDQTVRQVVRLEAGGNRIRVRLTNELGLATLKVSEVRVALSSSKGVTEAAADPAVTFGGRRGATLLRGQSLISDPVELSVRRFQDLAISIYYSGRVSPSGHLSRILVSAAGNHAEQSEWPRARLEQGPGIVSAIEVESATSRLALVAFGDSLTEGYGSTPGGHDDYPERLARLIALRPGDGRWVVINSGISGNQMLAAGAGPSALSRFDRDALDIPEVRAIILLEGINDIGNQEGPRGRGTLSARALIAAYRNLIRRAHARGLKIYLGTLTPYEGAGYYSPVGEAVREQVNAWIRRGRGFDGVIDFDAALRNPVHPARYIRADDSGDHLHPNDAGYRLMAEAAFRRLFSQDPLAGPPRQPPFGVARAAKIER
jgi:lysophospholipase L1-like esterase